MKCKLCEEGSYSVFATCKNHTLYLLKKLKHLEEYEYRNVSGFEFYIKQFKSIDTIETDKK